MTDTLATIGFRADTRDLDMADKKLDQLGKTGEQVEKKIEKSTDGMSRSFESVSSTVTSLTAGLAGLAAIVSANQVTKYADNWRNFSNVLKQVTNSTSEFNEVQDKVFATAQRTNSNLQSTAELYGELRRSTESLGVSSDRVLDVVGTINNLFLANGKSAEEASGAIRQLSQGLAAGALRGDEFNAVAEGAPRILEAMAKKLGMTRAELREFASQGGITAKIMVAALEDYSAEAQRLADVTERTWAQQSEVAQANITKWVGESKLLMSATALMSAGFVELSESIDPLVNSIAAGAAVLGGVWVVSAGQAAAATYSKIKADLESVAASNAAAIADKSRAVAAAQTAVQEAALSKGRQAASIFAIKSALEQITAEQQLEAVRMKAQISEIGRIHTATRMAELGRARALVAAQLTAAESALLAVESKGSSATASLVAATTALAAAQSAATVTSRALGAAVAFMTGPWGILLTTVGAAAAAFYATSDSQIETAKTTKDLKGEIDGLTGSIDEMSRAQRDSLAIKVNERLLQLQAESKALKDTVELRKSVAGFDNKQIEEFSKLIGVSGVNAETLNAAATHAQASLDGLETETKTLNGTLEQLKTMSLSASVGLDKTALSAEELEKQLKRIAKAEQDMEDAFGGEDMLTEVYQNRAKAAEKLMDEWSEGVDEFQSQGKAIDSLVTSVTNLGGAWSSSGSAMIDAFGSAADVIDDYIKRVGEVSDLEVKLKAVRDDSSSSAIDKSKAEVALLDLQYQGQRANLSMLSKTAGAAASMFKEQSKERKALHMAEKAFAAVEIALAMQKAGASAVAAIANQGTGDPYTAFARIAAMMGIMAGLGVFSGGGGGGGYSAPTSGTGTVTGDSEAKSGSIGNASDEFKDIALDQLFELQGIRESMNQLAGGIANLAVSLIRSSSFGGGNAVGIGKSQAVSAPSFMQEFGDKFSAIDPLIGVFDGVLNKVLAGVFGTTKKTLIDTGLKFDSQSIADILSNGFNGYYYNVIETTKKKMFGLSKKTSTGTEVVGVESAILDEIGAIFGYLSSSVTSAVDLLGVDAANAIDTFVVNLGSVSFKDMTGDEIQKELEAMFSQQGDLMAEYVFPHIKQYQQMGEGALEALMRVSKEQAMFDDGLNKIGQSLSSASRIMQIDVAQAIATMMGGMDEFASKTNQYFKAFFSESEQFDYLAKSLAEAMSGIGLPMVSSREGFRSIVDGLDLTTESGQRMFATLMQLVPGMDDYFNAIEKQKSASEAAAEAARKEAEAKAAALKAQGLDLQLRLYDALGQSAEALALRRQMELDATDETLRALLLQIYAAEDAAAAQRELASAQETAAQAARDAASAAIDAAQNAFGKLQESAQREKDRLGTELDLKLEAINAEKDLLKQQRDSVIDGYQEQGKAVEQYINKLEGLNDILTGFLSDTGTQANPFKELAMIYNEAKAGLLPESSRLSSVLSGVSGAGSAGFGSAFEQNRAMAIARNQAAGIQGIVGGAMGGAKSQLQWIEHQATAADEYYIAQLAKLDIAAETAQKLHDEQVGKIDEQLTEAQKQLNALLGVDDRLLTIDQALIEFYAAMSAANELGLGVASEQVAAINRVEAAIVQVGQQIVEIAKPDGRVWVPPTMPDRYTTDGKVVTQEMLDVLTQILHAQEATAKHTKTTADVVELNQYEAQEAAL